MDIQKVNSDPAQSPSCSVPDMPPPALFGQSHSFGGGAEPIGLWDVRRWMAKVIDGRPFNGRNGQDLTFYEDGSIQTPAGWYAVLEGHTQNEVPVRALVYAAHHAQLAPRCAVGQSENFDTTYLVYAGHESPRGWKWIASRIADHTDAVIGAKAASMLYRTAVGVYQSSAVAAVLKPSGPNEVAVTLSANINQHPGLEPVGPASTFGRLQRGEYVLTRSDYRTAEQVVAADFAQRQERTAKGKDPLTLRERLGQPSLIASRLLQEGEQRLNWSDWRAQMKDPKQVLLGGLQVALMAGKAVMSGAGILADMAVDSVGAALGYVRRTEENYHLPLNDLTREFGEVPRTKSLLARTLMPLRAEKLVGFRMLDGREHGLSSKLLPFSQQVADGDYVLNPLAVPGSLVKFWMGPNKSKASLTVQRPDGVRVDYALHNGALETAYARYLPAWRGADAPPMPEGVRAMFAFNKVTRIQPTSNGEVLLSQIEASDYRTAIAPYRTPLFNKGKNLS